MSSRTLRLLTLGFVLTTGRLVAQDATVTAPAFLNAETTTADAPPRFKHKVSVDYPDDLRKDDVQGYALTFWVIDITGSKIVVGRAATHPLFGGLLGVLSRDKGETTTMTKDGKPVAGLIWHSVIFNPASAGTKKKDASPRLLAVFPAQVPSKELGKVNSENLPVVWAKVQLDITGAITTFELENPEAEKFRPAIATAFQSWKIAPARQAGEAVAAAWRVPVVLCSTHPGPKVSVNSTPPRVLHSVAPAYPRSLVRDNIRGEVKVALVVDEQGHIQDTSVISSSHPVFSQLALDAIKEWRFAPATKDGKPVKSKIVQMLQFAPDSFDPQGGDEAVRISGAKHQENLPPELRFDVPPKATGASLPVYPYAEFAGKKKGKATVAMLIDVTGHVTQTKVIEASAPEFGLALAAAIEESTFIPALKSGQPTLSLVRREQDFYPGVANFLTNDEDRQMLTLQSKHPERIVSATNLDAPLKPALARKPVTPCVHRLARTAGSAVVEIIIGEDGRVFLPKIIEASAPEFGYAAAQAVKQWVFNHPTSGGKPVNVRVRVPIEFKL